MLKTKYGIGSIEFCYEDFQTNFDNFLENFVKKINSNLNIYDIINLPTNDELKKFHSNWSNLSKIRIETSHPSIKFIIKCSI